MREFMKLPESFRKRYVYTLLLGLSGVVFCLYFSKNAYPESIANRMNAIIFGMTAFPAAYVTWPKTGSRSYKKMTIAGIKTAMLAFVFLAILYPSWMMFTTGELIVPGTALDNIMLFILVGLGVIILGPILSMGVPFAICILLSLLFVDQRPTSEHHDTPG